LADLSYECIDVGDPKIMQLLWTDIVVNEQQELSCRR